jgi:hypothetical protein
VRVVCESVVVFVISSVTLSAFRDGGDPPMPRRRAL